FLAPPAILEGLEPNWQSYQISLRPDAPMTRNAVMDRLFDQGIPTRRGVMASHLEPPYRAPAAALPVTEAVAASTLQIPMHPALSIEQQDRVIEALARLEP